MITSSRHPVVLAFRRLTMHPDREPGGHMVLEGPHLVSEALAAGVAVDEALVAAGHDPALAELADRLLAAGARVHRAERRVVQAAGSVVTTQGIVAAARRPAWPEADPLERPDGLLLVADGIQDPGNLGTMVRTAVAAGASGVAVTGAAVDPYGAKVVRATAGAIFRIAVARFDGGSLRDRLRARGARIVIADPREGEVFTRAGLTRPLVIVVGNEAAGPDPLWRHTGECVRIPLYGQVESLNAAIAAALLLYEAVRDRNGIPTR